MIMPIGDDNTGRQTIPVANYILIALNVLVFLVFQGMGANDAFTYAFSTVPAEIVSGKDLVTEDTAIEHPETGQMIPVSGLKPTPVPVYFTILTSMFMHGGLMHLAGNMLFLWIFGDNIEDDLGHGRYVAYYLLCGVAASLAHVLANASGPSAEIPSLGASGAISGVMGGYLIQHPHRRVRVIMFRMLTEVPAIVAIGIWFAFQLISGLASAGATGGGVAYGAHIGGFIAGLVLIKPFLLGRSSS